MTNSMKVVLDFLSDNQDKTTYEISSSLFDDNDSIAISCLSYLWEDNLVTYSRNSLDEYVWNIVRNGNNG